jgi:hypothetical protein
MTTKKKLAPKKTTTTPNAACYGSAIAALRKQADAAWAAGDKAAADRLHAQAAEQERAYDAALRFDNDSNNQLVILLDAEWARFAHLDGGKATDELPVRAVCDDDPEDAKRGGACIGVFVCASSERGLEVQACDTCNRFADDGSALRYVQALLSAVQKLSKVV